MQFKTIKMYDKIFKLISTHFNKKRNEQHLAI